MKKLLNKLVIIGLIALTGVTSVFAVVSKVRLDQVKTDSFELASKRNFIPSGVLRSICTVESKLDQYAINHYDNGSPSYGICQTKLESVRSLGFTGNTEDLMGLDVNIEYAARLLKYQLDRYKGNVDKAIRAYNLGYFDGELNSEYHKKVYKVLRSTK